ncbi:MAG: site-specific DNA-methyltransferase, partial [Armatimonadota bacterium]
MARPSNELNDLTGTEWIKFTRTWFVCDSPRYHRNKDTELHPARFPEEMVADFLRFFTKERQFVLDPFAGSGATLVACLEQRRQGVGIELSPRYAAVAQRRLVELDADGLFERVIQGDTTQVADPHLWEPQRDDLTRAGLRFDD